MPLTPCTISLLVVIVLALFAYSVYAWRRDDDYWDNEYKDWNDE